jgi:hypothetical protein
MKVNLNKLKTVIVPVSDTKVILNPTVEDCVKDMLRVSKNLDVDASVLNNNTEVFAKAIKSLSKAHNRGIVLAVAGGAVVAYVLYAQNERIKKMSLLEADKLEDENDIFSEEDYEVTEEKTE